MRTEWLYTNIWIPPELQGSALRTVADLYVAHGWTVCNATACDMALKDSAVESLLWVTSDDRVACGRQLPSDKWLVEVELDKGGLRRNNRTVGFAYSSEPAPWLDHPVEVEIPLPDYLPGEPRGKGTLREMKMALEELAWLSEATLASWAYVSFIHGAPSIPELLDGNRPSHVDLRTVFLSDLDFDDRALSQIPEYAHREHWAAGWLISVSPYLQQPLPDAQVVDFDRIIWRLLSSWAHQQKRW